MPSQISPFLTPSPTATADNLSILHLKRDLHLPTILRSHDTLNEGYAEGKVTNTRFGSFPHSTLIDVPWGTQVRASEVDTGTRGRKGWSGRGAKKRKRGEGEREREGQVDGPVNAGLKEAEKNECDSKKAIAASTGFVHLLPPTPELWTASLPHRTQVVYTPDYSYILQRLRVRPGSIVIEAGAGSGSFTHAAARAVFNGYPDDPASPEAGGQAARIRKQTGKVYSFEFHKQRFESLRTEINEHGLNGVVELTHRDVCSDGFMLGENGEFSPRANAIFLDLPAPWLALTHLTRRLRWKGKSSNEANRQPSSSQISHATDTLVDGSSSATPRPNPSTRPPLESPLDLPTPTSSRITVRSAVDPTTTVHICTFSPCIEQVQRTISTLRSLGWHSISMVELSSRRIEVHRQRVGLQEEGLRGVDPSPANVEEAVSRLREVEGRSAHFHELERRRKAEGSGCSNADVKMQDAATEAGDGRYVSKAERLERIKSQEKERKLYKEGRLIHRSEMELKAHTSYLVFAFLPQEWSDGDEKRAQETWSNGTSAPQEKSQGKQKEELWKPTSQRQQKKASKASTEKDVQETIEQTSADV
jgi:tRNA (adenine57-N1/adenine58-N1)-methyltransferase